MATTARLRVVQPHGALGCASDECSLSTRPIELAESSFGPSVSKDLTGTLHSVTTKDCDTFEFKGKLPQTSSVSVVALAQRSVGCANDDDDLVLKLLSSLNRVVAVVLIDERRCVCSGKTQCLRSCGFQEADPRALNVVDAAVPVYAVSPLDGQLLQECLGSATTNVFGLNCDFASKVLVGLTWKKKDRGDSSSAIVTLKPHRSLEHSLTRFDVFTSERFFELAFKLRDSEKVLLLEPRIEIKNGADFGCISDGCEDLCLYNGKYCLADVESGRISGKSLVEEAVRQTCVFREAKLETYLTYVRRHFVECSKAFESSCSFEILGESIGEKVRVCSNNNGASILNSFVNDPEVERFPVAEVDGALLEHVEWDDVETVMREWCLDLAALNDDVGVRLCGCVSTAAPGDDIFNKCVLDEGSNDLKVSKNVALIVSLSMIFIVCALSGLSFALCTLKKRAEIRLEEAQPIAKEPYDDDEYDEEESQAVVSI